MNADIGELHRTIEVRGRQGTVSDGGRSPRAPEAAPPLTAIDAGKESIWTASARSSRSWRA